MIRTLLIAMVVIGMVVPIKAGGNPYAGKKLIEYGWDVPTTEFVRKNIEKMEKIPFDGVVIYVGPKPGYKDNTTMLPWRVFSKVRFRPDEYEHAIADLKATKFTRFTDNFIGLISMPGDVDWFDPEWSAVAHNAGCLAKVAKQGGCKGIMFDPEDYGQFHIWSYSQFSEERRASHTFAEYQARVRERGREFMRAINKEYPDITILCLYGPSLPYLQSQGGLEKASYGLLAAFYDGMLDAASPRTIIVDGFESSYGYRKREHFQEGRNIVLERAKTISSNPKEFEEHIRNGFGIWVDYDSAHIPWQNEDFSKNYWTPEQLRASLSYALELSDRYVWVYTERIRWWDSTFPEPYVRALALAKQGPGGDDKKH